LERSFVSEPWRAVHSIGFVRADAAEFLQQVPARSFQAFSLSNIGNGVTREYAERLRQRFGMRLRRMRSWCRGAFGNP
jgi:hypothetical protein